MGFLCRGAPRHRTHALACVRAFVLLRAGGLPSGGLGIRCLVLAVSGGQVFMGISPLESIRRRSRCAPIEKCFRYFPWCQVFMGISPLAALPGVMRPAFGGRAPPAFT